MTVLGSHESMLIKVKLKSRNVESTSFQNYKSLTRKKSITSKEESYRYRLSHLTQMSTHHHL